MQSFTQSFICLSASDIRPIMGNYLFLFWPNLTYGYDEWPVDVEKREVEKNDAQLRDLENPVMNQQSDLKPGCIPTAYNCE